MSASCNSNIGSVPQKIAGNGHAAAEDVPNSSVGGTAATRDTNHDQNPAVDTFP